MSKVKPSILGTFASLLNKNNTEASEAYTEKLLEVSENGADNYIDNIKLLLEKGADPYTKNKKGYSSFNYAERIASLSTFKTLGSLVTPLEESFSKKNNIKEIEHLGLKTLYAIYQQKPRDDAKTRISALTISNLSEATTDNDLTFSSQIILMADKSKLFNDEPYTQRLQELKSEAIISAYNTYNEKKPSIEQPQEFLDFLEQKPYFGNNLNNNQSLAQIGLEFALENFEKHPKILETFVDLAKEQNSDNLEFMQALTNKLIEHSNQKIGTIEQAILLETSIPSLEATKDNSSPKSISDFTGFFSDTSQENESINTKSLYAALSENAGKELFNIKNFTKKATLTIAELKELHLSVQSLQEIKLPQGIQKSIESQIVAKTNSHLETLIEKVNVKAIDELCDIASKTTIHSQSDRILTKEEAMIKTCKILGHQTLSGQNSEEDEQKHITQLAYIIKSIGIDKINDIAIHPKTLTNAAIQIIKDESISEGNKNKLCEAVLPEIKIHPEFLNKFIKEALPTTENQTTANQQDIAKGNEKLAATIMAHLTKIENLNKKSTLTLLNSAPETDLIKLNQHLESLEKPNKRSLLSRLSPNILSCFTSSKTTAPPTTTNKKKPGNSKNI